MPCAARCSSARRRTSMKFCASSGISSGASTGRRHHDHRRRQEHGHILIHFMIQPQTERYLDLVRQGKNQWWRYLAGVLVILLFTEVLGALPFLLLARGDDFSRLGIFITLNLGSLIGLGGLVIVVTLIHRRSLLSLVTPHPRLDWRRTGQGFAVWFMVVAACSVVESVLFPGRYRLAFNPDTFFVFAVAVLCLTPLQAASEELLFRGYVMQALGLLVKKPVVIAIVSSVLFMAPHLVNPEVAQAPLLVPPQYLVIGMLLAAVTLRDGRLELALRLPPPP